MTHQDKDVTLDMVNEQDKTDVPDVAEVVEP